MKTNLNRKITTIDEAKDFLHELWENGESFHPEDSAHDVIWNNIPESDKPTEEQCYELDRLMIEIYDLSGGDHQNPDFDPCEYLLELDGEEDRRMSLARPE